MEIFKDLYQFLMDYGIFLWSFTTFNKDFISKNKSPLDDIRQILTSNEFYKIHYNESKYNWIQLAGHVDRFKTGNREGFILKHMDNNERKCYQILNFDNLSKFVPIIDRNMLDLEDGKYYTEMQDLLYGFKNPSVMDIKIGVRTFLENDNVDEKETIPRRDLYERLLELAPEKITDEEHTIKAITKKRYMSWREQSTSSSTLGFRIEGIKINQILEKDFYTVKEKEKVIFHIRKFTNNDKKIVIAYLDKLNELKESLENSEFFFSHEIIGSSLLFIHDCFQVNIYMIDFGKTRPLPKNVRLTHKSKWIEGNHEDGYLIGINSLIEIFKEIAYYLK